MCPHCNTNAEMMLPISTVLWIVIAAVLSTLILSWIIFHHFWFNKKTYPKFCQRLEHCIEIIGYWLQSLWYALLLTISSIYIILHFEECLNLTFTTDFNGYNVIFVFWLVLLILPLFEKIEGFGIGFKIRKQVQEYDALYKAAMKAANKEEILDAEKLEELHKNGGQDE